MRCAVIALVALVGACASGSAIVTGVQRAPLALEAVRLYTEPPAAFEVVGIVQASSDSGWTDQGSMDYAVAELRRQAARLGANGVLIDSASTQPGMVAGTTANGVWTGMMFAAQTIRGRAIFVMP